MPTKLSDLVKVVVAFLIFHLIVATVMYPWADVNDFAALPSHKQGPLQRFIALLYYTTSGFTTSGTALSVHARLFLIVWSTIVAGGIYGLNQTLVYGE